ncbi:MAG TPA: radical SAM protein [Armatimonadetes bacterium]|nr:radical SAM protein [Armatimonadota bacterium]
MKTQPKQCQPSLPYRPTVTVRVNELFYSLQGESRFAGQPCVFVRLAGCNLRCRYCDTAYTWTEKGEELSLAAVLEQVAQYGINLVSLTGGEPLLQAATPLLVTALCDLGYTVLVDTNGTLDISPLDPRAIVLLDLKTPGSGEHPKVRWDNLAHLKPTDEVKFVLTDRQDYEWAREVVQKHALPDRCRVVFSPATPLEYPPRWEEWTLPRELAAWILADRLPVALQTQLHRFLWPRVERGV